MSGQLFNIWLLDTGSWLMKGSPLGSSASRSEAGKYSQAEATELCCLIIDGKPLAAMVPIEQETQFKPKPAMYACSWEHRANEMQRLAMARGAIEGIAECLRHSLPKISEKLDQAAGYLEGRCKTAPGRDGEEKPHESSSRPQPIHGVES